MCSSILGDDYGATRLFDRLRRKALVDAFDIGLAERIASAVGGGRRGANPEWGEAGSLTAWRLGLASAAGLDIPDDLLGQATPAQQAWLVRMPGQPLERRAALAPAVVATGAISSAEANRLFAADASALDPSALGNSPGGQLRTVRIGATPDARMRALKALWGRAQAGTAAAYGWQVAAALASTHVAPSADLLSDAPALVAGLNGAGLSQAAAGWWRAASSASEAVRAPLWAQMVAVDTAVPMDDALYSAWAKGVAPHRAQLLAAGLTGLGRGNLGDPMPPLSNPWTAALDRAVGARRAGEVMVLAATGLQGQWADVPPDYLRRIAEALRAVGLDTEARLIVAEAANRG
jgi:hypothetical protein